nr:TonB-dependent receptor [Massilia sp. BJB1822]
MFVPISVQAEEQIPVASVLQKVVISGETGDVDASRGFVAGKLLITRKTIADSGVQSVAEVLRREPVITIGKDGRLGLIGLPGYTQILVDGAPPAGVDPFTLDLVHVEKIEIIKSATAISGPFGIAGTINIIRRKTERKTFDQLILGGSSLAGRPGANFSWMSNQFASDTPFSYNLTFSADRKGSPSFQDYRLQQISGDGESTKQLRGERLAVLRSENFVVGGEFSWRINEAHRININPDMGRVVLAQDSGEQRDWFDGRALTTRYWSRRPLTTYSIPVHWNWKIDQDSSLSFRLNTNRLRIKSNSHRFDRLLPVGLHFYQQEEAESGQNNFADLDYNAEFAGGHEFAAGVKISRHRTDASFADFIDGRPDATLGVLGFGNQTHSQTRRFYVQDDWRLNRSLSMSFGFSTERRAYRFAEGSGDNQTSFNMWSPTIHIAKKIDGNGKRQLRLSLARTFQPPAISQMLLHPKINRLAPCYDRESCLPNSADVPDSMGNPELRPERALGVNLSYTHGFAAGGEFLTEFYSRRIQNKLGNELVQENVVWSGVPRYVSRPSNLGEAEIYGINLEGRLAARNVWKDAPALELQGSVGFARSRLKDVPGTDSRLAGQLPWRAKLGGTYAAADWPVKLTFDANWLPADWTRESLTERIYQSSKFTLNAGVNWKIDSRLRLSLNFDNLLKKGATRIDEYRNMSTMLQRYADIPSYRRVAARLEMNL